MPALVASEVPGRRGLGAGVDAERAAPGALGDLRLIAEVRVPGGGEPGVPGNPVVGWGCCR
jgi:hypothetical protein